MCSIGVTLYVKGGGFLPAKQPRIHTVLDESLYETIKQQAKQEGISLSQKTRDLLKLAVEIQGDRALDSLVDKRTKNDEPSIPHDDFWAERE